MTVADAIRRYNRGRDPVRLAMKYEAMRSSPFVFLRGTCHLFSRWLSQNAPGAKAPRAWVCGDLHLENFGTYKGDNRLVYFDINDFDESALAPASWDLIRLLSSLHVGASDIGIKPADATRLAETAIDSYHGALSVGKAGWVEQETATGLVRPLMDSLQGRRRPDLLDRRTSRRGRARTLRTDGRKALPVTSAERALIGRVVREFARQTDKPGFYRVLDVAARIAGTGSLGVQRYVVLIEGKGSPDGNYLLDLKQAFPSTVAGCTTVKQPRWTSQAERVVALQRRLQAVSAAFLSPVEVDGQPFVLRALQPTEDRVSLKGASRADLASTLDLMGRCVAWAHLRSGGREGSAIADEWIEFGRRRAMRKSLLAAAQDAASDTRRDWKRYCAAYDAGEFKT